MLTHKIDVEVEVCNSYREDILSTVSDEFPLRVEHDYIEKIVTAMLKMKDQCQTEFKQKVRIFSCS